MDRRKTSLPWIQIVVRGDGIIEATYKITGDKRTLTIDGKPVTGWG